MTSEPLPSPPGPRAGRGGSVPRRSAVGRCAALTLALLLALAVPATTLAAGDAGPAPSWVDQGVEAVSGWLQKLLAPPNAPGATPQRPHGPERPDAVSGYIGPIQDPDGYAPATTSPPIDDQGSPGGD